MNRPAAQSAIPLEQGEKGPRDDFYCWKFQIWYPSEDCVYRHSQQSYPACAGCFQGRLNLRHVQKGVPVPVIVNGRMGREDPGA